MKLFTITSIFSSLFFTFLVFTSQSNAQTTFEKTYGGNAYEMGNWLCKTSDGGFILTGQSMSYGDADGDIYIVKTSAAGNVEWEKHYGSTELDGGNCIIESPDSGYLVIGHTEGWGNGDCEAYILKINGDGDSLWLRTLGDIYDDAAYSGFVSSDNTFVISGILQDPVTLYSHALLAKYDFDGNLVWEKTYGSGRNESAKQVLQTQDGGYVIAGYAPGVNDPAMFDVFLAKTDIDGNELWEKTFGGDSTEKIQNIVETIEGDLVLSGYINGSLENAKDVFLIKTNADGNEIWNKSFSVEGNDDARGLCIANDGSYVIAGTTMSISDTSEDIFIMKISSEGNFIWEKYFGGNQMDIGRCLVNDNSGFAITGILTANDNANLPLIKTDDEGNISGINSEGIKVISASIFPNPADNEVMLSVSDSKNSSYNIQITDVTGKELMNNISFSNQLRINCANWMGGIYFLKIKNEKDGMQKVVRLVKK